MLGGINTQLLGTFGDLDRTVIHLGNRKSDLLKRADAEHVSGDLGILLPNTIVNEIIKGVEKVYKRMDKAGMEDVTMRLYHGARHELLNETSREEIIKHTLEWIEDHLDTEEL